jgi:hypothetical protein
MRLLRRPPDSKVQGPSGTESAPGFRGVGERKRSEDERTFDDNPPCDQPSPRKPVPESEHHPGDRPVYPDDDRPPLDAQEVWDVGKRRG